MSGQCSQVFRIPAYPRSRAPALHLDCMFEILTEARLEQEVLILEGLDSPPLGALCHVPQDKDVL